MTEYADYMRRIKAAGQPVVLITCPHCEREHEVPKVPNTDTMAECPNCSELFFKVIDGAGTAHGFKYVRGIA